MTRDLKTNQLCYPVLRLSKGMIFPARNIDELDRCKMTALRSGFFNGLVLIDSDGRKLRVSGARKLRGVGPFFGFNIFLNQVVQIALTLVEPEQRADVEEVRRLVLDAI